MPRPTPDFVQVQLTSAAIAFAAGSALTVANGRRSFTFPVGTPQKIERSYEWNFFLKNHNLPTGEPMFELVPDASAAAASADATQAQLAADAAPAPATPAAPTKDAAATK